MCTILKIFRFGKHLEIYDLANIQKFMAYEMTCYMKKEELNDQKKVDIFNKVQFHCMIFYLNIHSMMNKSNLDLK